MSHKAHCLCVWSVAACRTKLQCLNPFHRQLHRLLCAVIAHLLTLNLANLLYWYTEHRDSRMIKRTDWNVQLSVKRKSLCFWFTNDLSQKYYQSVHRKNAFKSRSSLTTSASSLLKALNHLYQNVLAYIGPKKGNQISANTLISTNII